MRGDMISNNRVVTLMPTNMAPSLSSIDTILQIMLPSPKHTLPQLLPSLDLLLSNRLFNSKPRPLNKTIRLQRQRQKNQSP